ncbi:MAG: glutaredoxin family protein [Actinomycetota bacterium]|nr:glutaredoxin family protein [Actinomycetota bacterium]
MSDHVIVYTTPTCGPCRRLKRTLDEAGVPFREVDINSDPEVARRIEAATGGYRIVPTVRVSGRLLVNPPAGDVVSLAAGN